jgi:hypothetical protein
VSSLFCSSALNIASNFGTMTNRIDRLSERGLLISNLKNFRLLKRFSCLGIL